MLFKWPSKQTKQIGQQRYPVTRQAKEILVYFDWKKHLTLLLLSRFTDLLVCLVKMMSFCAIYLSFPGTLILSVFSFLYLFSWQHKLTMSSHLLRLCLYSGCAFKNIYLTSHMILLLLCTLI